jgi:hypothetical protein
MADSTEAVQRFTADSSTGRVSADELRMIRLQGQELIKERVVLDIGNLRIIENVIPVIVMVDQCTELIEPCFYVHALLDILRREKS